MSSVNFLDKLLDSVEVEWNSLWEVTIWDKKINAVSHEKQVELGSHIEQIIQVFKSKANLDHYAQSVPFEKMAANDHNLSVNCVIKAKDNRDVVDIAQLNAKLKTTVAKIDKLRKDIDAIVAEIEGEELGA